MSTPEPQPGNAVSRPVTGAKRGRDPVMTVLLALVVALGCLLAVLAGARALDVLPWAPASLALGLMLSAHLRWGHTVLWGGVAGTALSLFVLGLTPTQAATVPAVLALGALGGSLVLRLAGFDARFERARDVAALVLAVVFGAALPCALLIGALSAGAGALLSETLAGWLVLSIGGLGSALPALTIDRRILYAARPETDRIETAVALTLMVGLWGSLWALPLLPPAWVLPVHLGALVLVMGLSLRGRIATAASTALGAGLLALAGGTLASAGVSPPAAGPVGWLVALLAVLLYSHAAATEGRTRSQRWEWALDGSRLGVADWRLPAEPGFASAAWRRLTGHEASAWTVEDWLRVLHPADRERLQGAIDAARSGSAGRQKLELRLGRQGGWRWFEATLLVIERTAGGRPTHLLATLADVQERRAAKDQQVMSVSLFQHLHEGLLVTDADLHALDVNPAYTDILGVPRERLLGNVPALLRPNPGDPLARQQRAAMWAGLRDQGFWRGELLEPHSDGSVRHLQTTISTVRDPGGDLRYHVLVINDITEQRQQRERLERQAHFDELTRLPNRARLSELLEEAMRAADRDGYLLVVCYLDLDRFKPVNDRHGHAAGDRLLAELADRLRSALRSRENWADAAARLGGDEFVLLLRAGTLEEARRALDRVLKVVAQPYLIDPALDAVQVTTSIGATIYPIDHSDADTLLRHADHAMYSAKQTGRNRIAFFDPEFRRRTEERAMALGRVQEALDQGEFVLFWQPQVELSTGRVRGFEALLRWEHPQQGLVSPLQFLPLIENTGLGSRVGDWVLSQALEYLAQWRRTGLDIMISVNISARHLQEPDFAQRLAELLARHPEPLASHLELEVLETAAHNDIDATSALLARCRQLGVGFALDDFGTGHSNLTVLRRLKVDALKIDRSFVNHMLDDPQDRGIVEGVIGLARTFGYQVVAEGVESPAQGRILLDMGCQYGQGTGIAAPMPAQQVVRWARDYRGMFTLAPTVPGGAGNSRLA
jgi:diguanylate cyclase (GGDEF)-like protein/PAS domain S-box-containing protein